MTWIYRRERICVEIAKCQFRWQQYVKKNRGKNLVLIRYKYFRVRSEHVQSRRNFKTR